MILLRELNIWQMHKNNTTSVYASYLQKTCNTYNFKNRFVEIKRMDFVFQKIKLNNQKITLCMVNEKVLIYSSRN